jgi:hypothetical protein
MPYPHKAVNMAKRGGAALSKFDGAIGEQDHGLHPIYLTSLAFAHLQEPMELVCCLERARRQAACAPGGRAAAGLSGVRSTRRPLFAAASQAGNIGLRPTPSSLSETPEERNGLAGTPAEFSDVNGRHQFYQRSPVFAKTSGAAGASIRVVSKSPAPMIAAPMKSRSRAPQDHHPKRVPVGNGCVLSRAECPIHLKRRRDTSNS